MDEVEDAERVRGPPVSVEHGREQQRVQSEEAAARTRRRRARSQADAARLVAADTATRATRRDEEDREAEERSARPRDRHELSRDGSPAQPRQPVEG